MAGTLNLNANTAVLKLKKLKSTDNAAAERRSQGGADGCIRIRKKNKHPLTRHAPFTSTRRPSPRGKACTWPRRAHGPPAGSRTCVSALDADVNEERGRAFEWAGEHVRFSPPIVLLPEGPEQVIQTEWQKRLFWTNTAGPR